MLEASIARATGATDVHLESLQKLWGGYGELWRATLVGAEASNVIVKHVKPPLPAANDSAGLRSHRRKLRSYEIEAAFYRSYASRCDERCRVPRPLHVDGGHAEALFILEDLDATGFDQRRHRVSETELQSLLGWLAHFHATFLGTRTSSLWRSGTYWHLGTRPDELAKLSAELQRAAICIDERLEAAQYRTLLHGDAKLENFCFSPTGSGVAAVDFQYVGGGAGVKDVAYLLTSCRSSRELEIHANRYLDDYFRALANAAETRDSGANLDFSALEREWRALYPFACADFYRFLLGWSPRDATRETYLDEVTRAVLAGL